jgi:hypothetical protein
MFSRRWLLKAGAAGMITTTGLPAPLPSTAYDLSLLAGGDERDGEQRPGPGASRLEPHQ